MIFIAFDDLDKKIGKYCASCAKECLETIHTDIPLTKINGKILNQVFIDTKLAIGEEGQPFIFVAYCHGNEKSLLAQKEPFIRVGLNDHNFKGGLVYTNACLSVQELGPAMIEKGTRAYVGYDSEVPVFGDEDKDSILRRFDNYALILFLLGDYTIKEAVNKAKENIKNEIKKAYELRKVDFAAELIEIRDSFQILGNHDLKFSHLGIT